MATMREALEKIIAIVLLVIIMVSGAVLPFVFFGFFFADGLTVFQPGFQLVFNAFVGMFAAFAILLDRSERKKFKGPVKSEKGSNLGWKGLSDLLVGLFGSKINALMAIITVIFVLFISQMWFTAWDLNAILTLAVIPIIFGIYMSIMHPKAVIAFFLLSCFILSTNYVQVNDVGVSNYFLFVEFQQIKYSQVDYIEYKCHYDNVRQRPEDFSKTTISLVSTSGQRVYLGDSASDELFEYMLSKLPREDYKIDVVECGFDVNSRMDEDFQKVGQNTENFSGTYTNEYKPPSKIDLAIRAILFGATLILFFLMPNIGEKIHNYRLDRKYLK